MHFYIRSIVLLTTIRIHIRIHILITFNMLTCIPHQGMQQCQNPRWTESNHKNLLHHKKQYHSSDNRHNSRRCLSRDSHTSITASEHQSITGRRANDRKPAQCQDDDHNDSPGIEHQRQKRNKRNDRCEEDVIEVKKEQIVFQPRAENGGVAREGVRGLFAYSEEYGEGAEVVAVQYFLFGGTHEVLGSLRDGRWYVVVCFIGLISERKLYFVLCCVWKDSTYCT